MKSQVYVFGKFNGQNVQYPSDYSRDIFNEFDHLADRPATILTFRSGSLIYYGYIRRFFQNSDYIGFCVLLNDAQFSMPSMLFDVFEETLARMVHTGEIVGMNSQGRFMSTTQDFSDKEQLLQSICDTLQSELESFPWVKLPPVDYSVGSEEVGQYDSNTHDDETVRLGMAKYTYTCFSKAEDFDSPSVNSVRAVLNNLNQQKLAAEAENQALREANAMLVRQKAKLRYVLTIAFVAIVIFIVLMVKLQQLGETEKDLHSTKVSVSNLQSRTDELSEKVTKLSDNNDYLQRQLGEANATIVSKDEEISRLNEKVQNLQERLNFYEDDESYAW